MGKSISVLGSTGSIGTQSLEVIRTLGLDVCAITGNKNTSLLERQAREFKPDAVVAYDSFAAHELKIALRDTDTRVLSGPNGLIEAACYSSADIVITAVVGTVGLEPTLAAIDCSKRIALANKETLVCAGELVMDQARRSGAEILPVDSEHSAIFQCMGDSRNELKRIWLTASGGPFRGKTVSEISAVTKDDALRHPNWSMGSKITIDSATLMNKGLEFIEAMHLFDVSPDEIEILVHPQSIVHSMVEFVDSSVIAQLGTADMKIPIQLALTWPEREKSQAKELNLADIGALTFERPDLEVFPCLAAAIEAAKKGGSVPCVMNAANEAAVDLFLREKIGFMDIYTRVAEAMEHFEFIQNPSLEDILQLDGLAREYVYNF